MKHLTVIIFIFLFSYNTQAQKYNTKWFLITVWLQNLYNSPEEFSYENQFPGHVTEFNSREECEERLMKLAKQTNKNSDDNDRLKYNHNGHLMYLFNNTTTMICLPPKPPSPMDHE